MRRQLTMVVFLTGIGIMIVACGTTREARKDDKPGEDFKVALTQRQLARRRQTAEECLRHGVVLPEQYRQKGGGMLEDYVPDRPPCGIPAAKRIERAEADFRVTWQAVVGGKVPLDYEWLLSVKRRIAQWLDAEGLTAAEARKIWREAQWTLVGREVPPVVPASTRSASDTGGQFFARLDHALNRALDDQGIVCRSGSERHPCF